MAKRPPMKQEGHPAHNVPDATEAYNGDQQMIQQILAQYGAPMNKGDRDFDNDDY